MAIVGSCTGGGLIRCCGAVCVRGNCLLNAYSAHEVALRTICRERCVVITQPKSNERHCIVWCQNGKSAVPYTLCLKKDVSEDLVSALGNLGCFMVTPVVRKGLTYIVMSL
jgi:hypothetical protein